MYFQLTLQVIPIGSDSVKFQWSSPVFTGVNAEIDGYMWEAHSVKGSRDFKKGTTTSSEHEVTIDSLVPAQPYEFKVKAKWLGFEEVCNF